MSSKSNNRWIQHVREYAKENNISYACAVSHASKTYTRTTKDDKKLDEQLKTNEGLKMHMKRMRKQYNEGKDDDYQLNILKMKFNRFNNIVKNYIQKNDPTLYDALSIVPKQTPTETIISNDEVQEVPNNKTKEQPKNTCRCIRPKKSEIKEPEYKPEIKEPEIKKTIVQNNKFKYNKYYLKDAIDIYFAHKDQKLSNLGRMSIDRLKEVITRRNVSYNDINKYYNGKIDHDIETVENSIKHDKNWMNEKTNISKEGLNNIKKRIEDYNKQIKNLQKMRVV